MIYLDNAATSRFKPYCVKRAALREMFNSANPGRGSHLASIRSAMIVEDCRDTIRRTFFDGNVMFTKNCTEALNLGIFGVEPDKQVITTVYEHNSVLRPLKHLADLNKIRLTVLSPDEKGSFQNSLNAALKLPTSLAVFTAMSNVTGFLPNVALLASDVKAKSDAKVLVDMAQGGGHLKLDWTNIDMCAFAGHKSLHGLQGTGFLLAKPSMRLKALVLGGTGTSSISLEHPNDMPDGMEAGTINTVGIAALKKAIQWTEAHFDKINARIKKLTDYLYRGLKEIPSLVVHAADNGLVTCNFINQASSSVTDILSADYKICARSGLHCAPLVHKKLGTLPNGAVRFSLGWNNSCSDIEKTVEAMEDIASRFC